MEVQLEPNEMVTDTIGFSRMEFQFQPSGLSFPSEIDPKLKLHAAEAGGIQKRVPDSVRLKLKNHEAEASGIRRFFTQSLKPGVNENFSLLSCAKLSEVEIVEGMYT